MPTSTTARRWRLAVLAGPVAHMAVTAVAATLGSWLVVQNGWMSPSPAALTGVILPAVLASGALAAVLGVRSEARTRCLLSYLAQTAAGELAAAPPVAGQDPALMDQLTVVTGSMATAVRSIQTTHASLASEVGNLAQIGERFATAAENATTRIDSGASAAREASDLLTALTQDAKQVEESIGRIAEGTTEVTSAAAEAVDVAERTGLVVGKLGESSAEIGNVIKLITSIADQTNLLALNATIEAARAGAAGKGFAVVAEEVEQLASETARASDDIATRVRAIQSDTQGAVQAIQEIGRTVRRINEYQASIASAIEDQAAITVEMGMRVEAVGSHIRAMEVGLGDVASAVHTAGTVAEDAVVASMTVSALADDIQAAIVEYQV